MSDQHHDLSAQAKREQLAQLLRSAANEQRMNLSLSQQRAWFLHELTPDYPDHVAGALTLHGPLDLPRLQRSLAALAARHEPLRSSFVALSGRPLRRIAPALEPPLTLDDLSALPSQEQAAQLQRRVAAAVQQPFALDTPPLWRVLLLRLSPTEHRLVLTCHRSIADDWSLPVALRELLALYAAHADPAALPPLAARFVDAVLAQQRWLQSAEVAPQLAYWQRQLAQPPVLDLPTDYPRPPIKRFRGGRQRRVLPAATTAAVQQLAERQGVPPRIVLLAAWQVLLGRYTGQDDLTIGVAGDGRAQPPLDGTVGPLANLLVLRSSLAGQPSFAALLRQMAHTEAAAQAQQALPFERLVEALRLERDLSHNTLAQVVFSEQRWPEAQWSAGELRVEPWSLPVGTGRFDLTLEVTEVAGQVELALDYSQELFAAGTMEQMLAHYEEVLASGCAEPERAIGALNLLTEAERDRLLRAWGCGTTEPYPAAGLHRLVEAQVARTPGATALVFGERTLSYGELNERANQLARQLQARGVGPEVRVGICLERSLELVVALLAVLKAGGAYVPLDPDTPTERLQFLLEDSQSLLLLTQQSLLERLPEQAPPILCLDSDWTSIAQNSGENLDVDVTPDNLAYMIYTSGSTGLPKGVMLTHRSVVNNLTWRQNTWPLTSDDRMLQTYSYSFDPSVWSIFWPLIAGAQVVMIRPGDHYDSSALVQLMRKHKVSAYGAAPALHAVLLDEPGIAECTSLRYIVSGGEVLTGSVQKRFFERFGPEVVICNAYGPTEATIDATFWPCERVEEPLVAPIGRPIPNAQVYLLDQQLQLVPQGVPGELFIGGVGVARGYHQRPDLTAERFVPDPFGDVPGARLYRTGDLARYRHDGTIEFLDRVDDQVKIRGFRVELGEIETSLLAHPEVSDAVVLVREDFPGDKRLVAYVVPEEGASQLRDRLVAYLEDKLPYYMVPRWFVFLDEFPKTTSGKVDRNLLPAPEIQRLDARNVFIAPRTPLEEEIASIFASVLNVDRISMNDDFFDLGGNSLQMSRLATRLSNTYGVKLLMHQIFQVPTAAGIARVIELYRREGDQSVEVWSAAQLEAEVSLDPEIKPDGLPLAKINAPEHILLTGATGYLGAFLLHDLLKTSSAEIHCLVRAATPKEGMERLKKTLRQYHIWDETLSARIHPVAGDLAKPLLGLRPAQFSELAQKIDAIYHSAALVNFLYPYSALKATNVLGTQEILRLACQEQLKAVHYISTIDVFLANNTMRPFLEADLQPLEQERNLGQDPGDYTRSKWIAEKIVTLARARGVPIAIYRPGLLMGHTQTGATQTTDYLLVALRGFLELGIVPEHFHLFDAVPIDYASRSIVHISQQPDSFGKYFHLWNPRPINMRLFYDWIESYGYRFEIVPFAVGRERGMQVDPTHPLYPMIPVLREAQDETPPSFDPQLLDTLDVRVECANTLRALEGSGIECPQMDERLAHLIFSYLIEVGFYSSPEELVGADQAPGSAA